MFLFRCQHQKPNVSPPVKIKYGPIYVAKIKRNLVKRQKVQLLQIGKVYKQQITTGSLTSEFNLGKVCKQSLTNNSGSPISIAGTLSIKILSFD